MFTTSLQQNFFFSMIPFIHKWLFVVFIIEKMPLKSDNRQIFYSPHFNLAMSWRINFGTTQTKYSFHYFEEQRLKHSFLSKSRIVIA